MSQQAEESEVQGHTLLLGKFETNLRYTHVRPLSENSNDNHHIKTNEKTDKKKGSSSVRKALAP